MTRLNRISMIATLTAAILAFGATAAMACGPGGHDRGGKKIMRMLHRLDLSAEQRDQAMAVKANLSERMEPVRHRISNPSDMRNRTGQRDRRS